MKKTGALLLGLALSLFALFPLSAREAAYTGEDYNIRLFYNDVAFPGDAVFVRMIIEQNGKKNKDKQLEETSATLELFNSEKRLDKAAFYSLPSDSSKTRLTLLAGIALSSWLNSSDSYKLSVKYKPYGGQTMEFELPFGLDKKDFEEYTLQATQGMTNIQNDRSEKRMKQIEKLNKALGTFDTKGVYQTTAFVPPTQATRRTSYYAERRIYKYTNGKEVTSLHYGTDYGIPTGSKVTSCAAGKVVVAENRVTTGWSVCIEHLPGLYSLYYHMSELKVKEGDTVKAGDLIGLSGATGFARGPHLHWEMRLNMSAVNPDFFVNDFTFSASAQ